MASKGEIQRISRRQLLPSNKKIETSFTKLTHIPQLVQVFWNCPFKLIIGYDEFCQASSLGIKSTRDRSLEVVSGQMEFLCKYQATHEYKRQASRLLVADFSYVPSFVNSSISSGNFPVI